MMLPLLYPSLTRLRRLDVPLATFWSAYFALWPGVFVWGWRVF